MMRRIPSLIAGCLLVLAAVLAPTAQANAAPVAPTGADGIDRCDTLSNSAGSARMCVDWTGSFYTACIVSHTGTGPWYIHNAAGVNTASASANFCHLNYQNSEKFKLCREEGLGWFNPCGGWYNTYGQV